MAARKNPLFDTATTLGKIIGFLGVSAICGVLVAGLLVPAVAVAGTTTSNSISFFDQLPDTLKIGAQSQSTNVLASDGSTIATFYDQNRVSVKLDQMSPFIKEGIVAIEDSRFYEHGGIDSTGILRALVATAQGGRQGASTLTQQYVNNIIIQTQVANGETDQVKLGGDKTVGDKIREMKLAIALEKKYSKDQILEGYLNIVLFGNATYGIEAASQLYFGVSSKNLTLPEAALLAGVVNSPNYYDPIKNPDNAKSRRNLVLDKMLQTGKISKKDHDAAVASPVKLNVHHNTQGCVAAVQAPYFCDYVENQILANSAYGATVEDRQNVLYRGGLTIKTSLDPRLQKVAQAQVNNTEPADNPDQKGATLVTVQPGTGKILAMAQNTIYNPGKALGDTVINLNVDAKDGGGTGFQPGSTVKTVTFAQWLNAGKSMAEKVQAQNRTYSADFPWIDSCDPPGTYHGSYDNSGGDAPALQNDEPDWYRPMTVREGIAQSINTATFASAAQLDLCDITKMSEAMGLHSAADGSKLSFNGYLSAFIGTQSVSPLTMANAFATFASGGVLCTNTAITDVTDTSGKKYPVTAPSCKQSIKPEVAAAVNVGLQDVLGFGPGRSYGSAQGLYLNDGTAAAKTGTNEDASSTWIVGYTTKLATASWWGAWKQGSRKDALDYTYKGKFYPAVDGAYIAGPQWKAYMEQAVKFYPGSDFPAAPSNLVDPPYVAPVTPAPTQTTPPQDNSTPSSSAPATSAPAASAPATSAPSSSSPVKSKKSSP